MKSVTIGILDDERLSAKALKELLKRRAGFSVIFNEPTRFLHTQKFQLLQPDILLIDPVDPEKRGVELLAWFTRQYPDVHVVVHTGKITPLYKAQLAIIGIRGLILKSEPDNHIIPALENIVRGSLYGFTTDIQSG